MLEPRNFRWRPEAIHFFRRASLWRGNGIVAVQGDSNSQYSINAQLVGAGGTLIGPRISISAFA